MRPVLSLVALLVPTIIAGCGTTTTIRSAPDYHKVVVNQASVVLLPPEAHVVEIGSSGKTKRLYDFEYNIEQIIKEELLSYLHEQTFRANPLSRKDVVDLNLQETVSQLDARLAEVNKDLYKDASCAVPEKAFNTVVSFAPLVKTLYEKRPAQLYSFVRYNRDLRSSGAQWLGMAMSMFFIQSGPPDTGNIEISFFDGKTGHLLWQNMHYFQNGTFFSGSDSRDEERKRFRSDLKNMMKKFFENEENH